MLTVLDNDTRAGLIERIRKLSGNSVPLWGKMTVYQMLEHCVLADRSYLGKSRHQRSLIGRFLGKAALKQLLKDEKPMPRNARTGNAFLVKESNGDVEAVKQQWISLLEEYGNFHGDITHWFFGKMTNEQVGQFAYKHTDHHLRQFGC